MSEPTLAALDAPTSIFEQAKAQLQADLAHVPDGHTVALVAVADTKGIRAGFAAKVGDHWQIGGELEKKWKADPSARVTVRASW